MYEWAPSFPYKEVCLPCRRASQALYLQEEGHFSCSGGGAALMRSGSRCNEEEGGRIEEDNFTVAPPQAMRNAFVRSREELRPPFLPST